MRHKKIQTSAGFTAIELLITLMVAAVFLFASFQLYTQVTQNGADADRTARISNMVYDQLRTTASSTVGTHPDGCKPAYVITNQTNTQQVTGLGSIIYTTNVSCPYQSAPNQSLVNIFLIKISASDDGGVTQRVTHAILAN